MVIPEQVYVTSHACGRLRFIIELYENPQPSGAATSVTGTRHRRQSHLPRGFHTLVCPALPCPE